METTNLQKEADFVTKQLSPNCDYIAPDGSKIYLLPQVKGGGLCMCELQPGLISKPVMHKTVEEIWFFLTGEGEVWRKDDFKEEIVKVNKDVTITIPLGCEFQFKNTGDSTLRFIIATMPPWPGVDEAIAVDGNMSWMK